jgi:GH24 family phage-related lysozyme (muramidase)
MSPTIPPLSLQGLEFIKRAQGLALVPYRDESGLRVIGYGHVLNDYERSATSRARSRRPYLPWIYCNASASLSAASGLRLIKRNMMRWSL